MSDSITHSSSVVSGIGGYRYRDIRSRQQLRCPVILPFALSFAFAFASFAALSFVK